MPPIAGEMLNCAVGLTMSPKGVSKCTGPTFSTVEVLISMTSITPDSTVEPLTVCLEGRDSWSAMTCLG